MISEKKWRIDEVAQLFLAIISTLCAGMFLASGLEQFKFGIPENNRRFIEMAIMGIFFHVAAFLWISRFLKKSGMTWRDGFGFGSPNIRRAIGLGILAGLLFLPVAWGLQEISENLMNLVHVKPEAQAVVQELQKDDLGLFEKLFFGILTIVIAPVVEEAVFRGVLYPTIKQFGYPRAALWGTSLLFALTHFSMVTFLPLAAFAVVLALLYEATDNLIAPIVAHGVFNAANFCALVFGDWLAKVFHLT